MAAETAENVEETTAPKPVVKRLRAFAGAHGGATAVVEHLGRKGARIVLVGDDGAWGDQVVAEGTGPALEACAEAEVPTKDEWERELVTGIRTGPSEWNSMGGRH
ncbi:hypothetical protein [Cryptosporangium sp. NPDC051539]|uniref:hypothetical protein n=1 Tax=Cryptosporangium sp. NPDC051539 TaxID=3363962 RepID=UPI0037AA9322